MWVSQGCLRKMNYVTHFVKQIIFNKLWSSDCQWQWFKNERNGKSSRITKRLCYFLEDLELLFKYYLHRDTTLTATHRYNTVTTYSILITGTLNFMTHNLSFIISHTVSLLCYPLVAVLSLRECSDRLLSHRKRGHSPRVALCLIECDSVRIDNGKGEEMKK